MARKSKKNNGEPPKKITKRDFNKLNKMWPKLPNEVSYGK